MKIKSLIAATYAPMNQDTSLNLDLISSYSDFLANNKVAGAFVNGSTGDFTSLTVNERMDIVEAWAEIKRDDFALINHVGHTSLKVAKELATHSAEMVDAIATLSPFYFKPPSLESLVEYCSQIAACAPELPFYYYHIPVLTGANFSMLEFLKLASVRIPNLAGIKFTNNNLIDYSYCKKYSNGEYNILFGIDEIFLASLPLGAEGWVGSTYNHIAPLYHKVKNAFDKGDMKLASELQTKAMVFVDILNNKGGFNGTAKSYMKTLGIDCGPSRYPHKTLSIMELDEVTKELEDLDIMELTNTLVKI